MKSHVCCALALSAVALASASAEPLSLEPNRYGQYARQGAPPAPSYEREAMARAQTQRYAAAEPDAAMGGGFIQFLFGGGGTVRTGTPRPPSDVMHASAPPHGAQAEPMREAPNRNAIDPKFHKQTVPYAGNEKPGTIIIDTPNRFLFLVQDNGTAVRYGIGVGRPGFTWAGEKKVTAKKEWPDWTPPPEMLQRQPDLPNWMAGGPSNPLGARAMYLGSSLYRIHGSNEPWTIGQAVSSGCIRMRNEDVMDLYERVKVGTKVVVI